MSNIKNFGLVGVATDVQFGKAGPRLVNDSQVFKFKDAAGANAAQIVAGNATVAGLTVGALGTIDMGANKVTNMAPGALDADGVTFKQLTDAISGVSSTAAGDLNLLKNEVNAIETAIGLNDDGTLAAFATGTTAGPAAGATTYKSAIELVSAALAGEITRAQAAEALVAGDLTTEVTRAKAAEKAVADGLTQEILDRIAGDNALRTEMQTAIAGITWENPVNQMFADITAADAVTAIAALADKARVYDTATNKVYTVMGGVATAGELMVQGAAFFDKATTVPYVFNGTSMVQFNGAAGLSAGLGLVMTGNTMDLDLATTGGLRFYPDAANPNNTVGLKLADASLEVGTTGLQLSTALQTEIGALRTDLTAEALRADTAEKAAVKAAADALALEVTRATGAEQALGLRIDGVVTANGVQDDRLTALENKTSADSGALQTEVDFMEAALGLAADGKLVAFGTTGYLAADDTFAAAIGKLDAALKSMDGAYKAADIALHTAITAETTAAIDALTTDAIEEGTNNLYFTAARAQGAISVESVAGADAAKLAYVGGVLSLVNVASVKSVADALTAAKSYADAGDVTTLAAAKAYADAVANTAANSVKHVAKSVYQEFAYTDNPMKSIANDVQGRVHRVKIMIDVGFADASSIQVGTAGVNGELMTTADVDSTTPGVYVVEINKLYATPTELFVFVGGTNVAGAGAVIVEYFTV